MSTPHPDSQYRNLSTYSAPELEHHYGPQVHILADRVLLTELAHLCSPKTEQPLVNEYTQRIYTSLLNTVVNSEFPTRETSQTPTRMMEFHPEAVYQGPEIDPKTSVVSVNLARAGTLPSHICYSHLHYLIKNIKIRQDHISIARQTGQDDHVTGAEVSGHKIGGSVEDSIVLIPDPMGATGGTLVKTLDLYKKNYGNAKKYVALHCIVTPEYLKRVTKAHPDLAVYAVRLDRGLSSPEILDTVPGQHWDQEKGLNEKDYIVPGGGGFGEILNNAFV